MAVTVVIYERATRAPPLVFVHQAGFFGDIGKRTIAVVSVQDILPPIGHEHIVEAVVIEVTYTHGRRPTRADEPRLFGDVGECAVAIVLVQPVGATVRGTFQPRAAQKKNIQPSVIVVIDEGGAAAYGLDDVLFAVDAAVDHRLFQPGAFRDVHKVSVKR